VWCDSANLREPDFTTVTVVCVAEYRYPTEVRSLGSATLWTLLVLLTFAAAGGAQSPDPMHAGTPVTLSMDWKRGDMYYGPNFIQLHTLCANSDDDRCECVADFKGTTTTEFADYISSFKNRQVPVTYFVWYGQDGQVGLARLASVGDWQRDRFGPNDGNIQTRLTFRPNNSGASRPAFFNAPSDCFRGLSPRPTPSVPSGRINQSPAVPMVREHGTLHSRGALRVPAEEQRQRLVFSPPPEYPPDAEKARIQGAVVLEILVGKDGNVKEAKVISGHPQLAPAARIAVYQWQYRPVLRDDKPIDVITTVTVNFRLKTP